MFFFAVVVLRLEHTPESLGGLLKMQVPGPTPRVSDLLVLRLNQRTSISNKLPGDINTAGVGTTL